MGSVNQSFNDRVRYYIHHPSISNIKIKEPQGWDDDEKEYSRNKKYHGIFAKFSNSLKFVGKSAEIINEIIEKYDIHTNIRLTKDERNPYTDLWTRSYEGYLDLSTWKKEQKFTSVKFNSGGLEEILKSRESEELEIDRIESIDGIILPEINTEEVELEGRRIFLQSSFESKNTPDNYITTEISSNGNTRYQTGSIPSKIINQSHEELSEVPNQSLGDCPGDTNTNAKGTANMMFFLVSEVDRVLDLKIKDISFRTNVTRIDDLNHGYYQMNLVTYKDGSSFNLKNRITLFDTNAQGSPNGLGGDAYTNIFTGFNPNPAVTHTVSYEGRINLLAGESLTLEVLIHADLGSNTTQGHFSVTTDNISFKGFIDEDSVFEKTNSKFYLPYECFDRLVQIMTGKSNIFKSKFLGRTDIGYSIDGPGSLTGLAHGYWIRGFDKLPLSTEDEPNRFKPLTTSWKDAFDSFDAVWNIGLGIEKNGYFEKIIIEKLEYFYNRNVTIKLPYKVKNMNRYKSTEYYYSGIEIGFEKGGSYEEATGLDEYNGKTTFTTLIKVIKQKFIKVSKYRADSYGGEFCRRKPAKRYSTEDTSYDDDVFIFDLKRGDETYINNNVTKTIFKERKWQDDFAQVPTGTFSPNTATNLRFSPFNMMLRHGWQIMSGLTKYPLEYVRYGSSTANSQLKTKLRNDSVYNDNPSNTPGNGNEYSENGNIMNKDFIRSRFVGEILEFEHIVDFNINQLLQGFTIFNGEKVYNVYGLVELINEFNKIERGWLLGLKPNKEGKWQVLKCNN